MRILHVIPKLEIGGAQGLLENVLPLISETYDISVVVYRKTGSEIEKNLEKKGIPVYSLEASPRSPKAITRLKKYLKNADLIHFHLFPTQYYGILSNIGINKPIIFTEHSTFNKRRNHKFLKPIEKIIYKKFLKIVCISEPVRNSLAEWLSENGDTSKFTVIENGINLPRFENPKASSRKELFGREGTPLLMISRFTDSKDHETVVKSLLYLRNPDIYVVFVGEGENRNSTEELAERLGVREKIIFLGERKDIPEIIKTSEIGIQSSNWEGFGLSAIEMMAGGIPVVASDVEGLNAIIKDKDLLFRKGDAEDLAYKIDRLLSDSKLYSEKVQKVKETAGKFSIDKTAKKYIDLYSEIFNS